ncbi:hypothetical protein EX30DRAFT_352864 [Ascodesmis nigricans]|uniref:Oxidoreductase N-terminal domain-containing protein n=1 Tax=Ascodesmis nigricans TaxID=341454 RepID=A0A4S2MLY1_9PEZI|nr:hypothetical protein EX30DRAFT_352864 [Ascodesmis nigricans]
MSDLSTLRSLPDIPRSNCNPHRIIMSATQTYEIKEWRLKQLPQGEINPYEDFELVTKTFEGPLEEGHVLVELVGLSNDPAQRTWLVDKPASEHYMSPVGLQHPHARHRRRRSHPLPPRLRPHRTFPRRPHQGLPPHPRSPYSLPARPHKAPTKRRYGRRHRPRLHPSAAYAGLLGTGEATSTDNVIVVSGAAGATGSTVVQIAKNVLGVKHV